MRRVIQMTFLTTTIPAASNQIPAYMSIYILHDLSLNTHSKQTGKTNKMSNNDTQSMHLFNSYLSVRNVQANVFHKLFSTVFHVKQHQNHMNYEHTHRPCHIHYANSYKKCCKQNTVLFIFVSSSPRKKVYLGTPSPHIFYLHHMALLY